MNTTIIPLLYLLLLLRTIKSQSKRKKSKLLLDLCAHQFELYFENYNSNFIAHYYIFIYLTF